MKAIRFESYGGPEVLNLVELDRPTPGTGEVVIRVHASSINAADYRIMAADPFLARLEVGLLRPKKMQVLGIDVAGVVDEIGPGVTALKVGDEVFGDTFQDGMGGFAEFACVRASALVKKPSHLSFAEAAAVPLAAITALQALRDRAHLKAGDSVLVQGAGGGVGSFLVQMAKAWGATVTAVCGSASMDLMRSLGADHVLDYNKQDFTDSDQCYHAIFGVNGYHSLADYKKHLLSGGVFVFVGGANRQIFESLIFGPLYFLPGNKRFELLTIDNDRRQNDLQQIQGLLVSKQLRPIIDRVFQLPDTAAAMRYARQGHVRGKIVIQVDADQA